MVASAVSRQETTSVAVLFSPDVVPIVDIFRAVGDFEERYDVAVLDMLEDRLAGTMSRVLAKGIISDALLLAFGLRRERTQGLEYGRVQSRRGTVDEYRLMALLGATYRQDFALAAEAAATLDITHPQSLISIAFDIAWRLNAAGMALEAPDLESSVPQVDDRSSRSR
jgi:hypothetical protein